MNPSQTLPGAETKLRAIAKILGVDATDTDKIAAAFGKLFTNPPTQSPAPDAEAQSIAASRLMTPGERKAANAAGCKPLDFVAMRAAFRGGAR